MPHPAFVDGFDWAVGEPGTNVSVAGFFIAAVMLLLMFAVPAFGFASIFMAPVAPYVSQSFSVRARRLSYATVVAPTLYCFVCVNKYLLGDPLPDQLTWVILWGLVIGYFVTAPLTIVREAPARPWPWLRVAHGISALVVVAFVAFHLTNHLFAWEGETAHSAVMAAGPKVYRSPLGEPVLVIAMLFQVVSGLALAWRWSAARSDFYRAFQVASGLYLTVYIIGHMNSVFVFARAFIGIPTGWDFATGPQTGSYPWSVRLIPHYAIGVSAVSRTCSAD